MHSTAVRRRARHPFVSCVMVTKGRIERFPLLLRSIRSFCAQTHPNRELVIVLDSPKPADGQRVMRHVRSLGRKDIVVAAVEGPRRSFGAVRNFSVDRARGALLCHWDDDDYSHPRRIETQLRALLEKNADAVVLGTVVQLFVRQRACVCVNWGRHELKGLPSTILFRRSPKWRYAETNRREDSALVRAVRRKGTLLTLQAPPYLYVYVFHGANGLRLAHHLGWALALAEPRREIARMRRSLVKGLRECGLATADLRFLDRESAAFLDWKLASGA